MGGIGLRIWEVAQVLAERFEVEILVAEASDLSHIGIRFLYGDRGEHERAIDSADVVLFNDLPDPMLLLRAFQGDKLIVSENAVPLEHLEYASVKGAADPDETYAEVLDGFRLQLLVSDHFLVRSPVERASMLGALVHAGRISPSAYRDPRLSDLVSLLPIGFNAFSQRHAEAAQPVEERADVVWSGGIWEYLDAASVPSAVAAVTGEAPDLSVLFMYPPPAEVPEGGRLRAAVARHRVTDRVRILDDAPLHPERDAFLTAAFGLVCTAKEGVENQTCERLRLRDVWLYRLPIIVDRFGATGALVERLGVGVAVDPATRELADALLAIGRDTGLRSRLRANVEAVRERFRIESNVEPLVAAIGGYRPVSKERVRRRAAVERLLDSAPSLSRSPTPLLG